jgi:hypothetical protein
LFFALATADTPKCYAQRLGGCSSKISGEHAFTESVMGKGGLLGMRGFPKIPDSMIGISSATANVLCTDHNSLLSPLDSEAKKLSDALDQYHAATSGTYTVVLKGPLFERWLLKVVMGYLAAGYTPLGRQYPSSTEVVAALFGLIPMAPPIGMYSMTGVDRWSDYTKEVLFRELTAIDPAGAHQVVGAFIALHGFPFLFSLGGPFAIQDYLRRPDGTSYLDPYDCTNAKASFHPTSLTIRDQGQKQMAVEFKWP